MKKINMYAEILKETSYIHVFHNAELMIPGIHLPLVANNRSIPGFGIIGRDVLNVQCIFIFYVLYLNLWCIM